MLQHCLSKQTLYRRDCEPLECQERSFVNGTLLNLVFLAAEGNSKGSHEIRGRTMAWIPSEPVEIHDWEHGIETAGGFAKNPVPSVMETGQPLIVRPR
jgi:hypothetical protein